MSDLLTMSPESIASTSFRKLVTPISYDEQDTQSALRSFFECITAFVPQLTDVGEVKPIHLKIIEFLRDPTIDQFFGLTLNYCYWNCVHPIARAVLKTALSHNAAILNTNYPRFMSSGDKTKSKFTSTSDDDSIETQSSAGLSIESSAFEFASIGSDSSYTVQEKENMYLKLEICITALNKKVSHKEEAKKSSF